MLGDLMNGKQCKKKKEKSFQIYPLIGYICVLPAGQFRMTLHLYFFTYPGYN